VVGFEKGISFHFPASNSYFLVLFPELSVPTEAEKEMLANVIFKTSLSSILLIFLSLQLKENIEAEVGQQFQNFELINYSTQVVAGTVYLMRVRVDGDEYLHVKIIKPLPHTNMPPGLMTVERGMSADSPLIPR
jgi:cystatin-A/B